MFEDDIDIDFEEILNCSQPTNQTLKRSCSELFENEANKKLKTVSKTCINANNSPLSSRESIESSTSHLEPENFHSTKTSTTSENQNQRSIQQVNLSQQASTSRNNFIAEKVYVNKNTEKHVDNKICRLKSSDSNATRRKFPGPAGILPERGFNAHMSEHLDRSASSESKDEICSQTTGFIFSDGPWERMKVDHLPKSNGETFLPDKYNIHWIKNKVIMKKLINQKAPFLAAFVHSIRSHSIQNPIVNLTLKDKTGTIQGTILHNLYEEYSSDLSVGSVIVLKDISVLNTGSNNEPYLTITPNNLISIYTSNQKSGNSQNSSSQNSNNISKVCVQSISAGEILSNINELKRLYKLEIDNSKRNIQRISSKIEIGGKTSICDNFKKAVYNANREKSVLKPNLHNLKPKSIVNNNSNNMGMDSINIRVNNKFVGSTSNFSTNNKKENDKIVEIMDLFNSEEDMDEFFKEEPNFCSTQISEKCTKNKQNISPSKSVNAKMDCDNTKKEHSQIWENMFEGVDANSLFDDF